MKKGFTTLGLIAVIAIVLVLGVFAVILINPNELALQKRDAERKKMVTTVGEALIAYANSKNGVLPHENENWLSDLQARGDLKKLPEEIEYDEMKAACKKVEMQGICYDTDTQNPPREAIIYTKLESVNENTKCNVSLGETAWYVYDKLSFRAGLVCTIGIEPTYKLDGQNFKD